MTGKSIEEAKKEVDLSIQRLFYWGAYADKYGGTVQVGEISVLFVLRCSICLSSLLLSTIHVCVHVHYNYYVCRCINYIQTTSLFRRPPCMAAQCVSTNQ